MANVRPVVKNEMHFPKSAAYLLKILPDEPFSGTVVLMNMSTGIQLWGRHPAHDVSLQNKGLQCTSSTSGH